MITPLRQGDRVALCATARAVSPDEMQPAIDTLRGWGLEVVVPDGLYARAGQLAGDDTHRAALTQSLFDDPTIKAIVCCRGGYGTVRVIDRLDFSPLLAKPKWLVGYSDFTVVHCHATRLGLPTLHATMPINFTPRPTPATESLRRVLFGQPADIGWQASEGSDNGVELRGVEVVGGNLSIVYSLLGSASQPDTRGRVLLLEDLDEYLYHIDRMMQALRRAGLLGGLRGLLVGGMTDMHDNTVPFGMDTVQIVRQATAGLDFPVLFGAPFGHLGGGNMALPLGTKLNISCDNRNNCRIFAADLCC